MKMELLGMKRAHTTMIIYRYYIVGYDLLQFWNSYLELCSFHTVMGNYANGSSFL